VLKVDQPFANHNGGQLAFGRDGYLYIGMGDGGSGGDPQNNGQKPSTLLGKMLRIDVESGQVPYAIPPSNPFRQKAGYRPEIWALGLRNPWRFSFDRETGDLYIGDVGQNAYEEVDFQPSSSKGGQNYGWKIMEGTQCFESNTCDKKGLTLPVVEYEHSQGCSVTGGVVYRGQNYPGMRGIYFYGDYCSGRVWGLKRSGTTWQNTLLSKTSYSISSFGEDQAGNVYMTDYGSGDIYLIKSQ
jgi:glucose/arabinose dehydrogenase